MKQHMEPLSPKARAANARRDAAELERRGFPCLAEVAREMAEWLDPAPRPRPERPRRRTRPVATPTTTPSPARIARVQRVQSRQVTLPVRRAG